MKRKAFEKLPCRYGSAAMVVIGIRNTHDNIELAAMDLKTCSFAGRGCVVTVVPLKKWNVFNVLAPKLVGRFPESYRKHIH